MAPVRNVMLIGGINHAFDEAAPVLVDLFQARDVETVVTDDVAEALEELSGADMFTLYALRWRMLNDEKYAPDRARWAYELPEAGEAALADFVESGGALLGLHTASICFDTFYEFKSLLGGVWRWDQTFHPPVGTVDVRCVGSHEIAVGVPPFQLVDEVYHQLDVADGSELLAEARVPGGDWQPVAWARESGDGRVVYSALGHDAASLADPAHRRLLGAAIDWLLD